jgi:cytochrome c-type protein NapB
MNEPLPSAETRAHHTAEDFFPARFRRFIPLLAAIAASLAVVGFVTGIREPAPTSRPARGPGRTGPAPAAVSYTELPAASLRPNANRHETLASLESPRPRMFDPVVRTEEMKLAALADRARNRAFDGAPPTIPHPVAAQSAASCLVCHGEGLVIGTRVATKISHAHLSNCTQCHVESARSDLPFAGEPAENEFVGVYRAGPGERASPGAPPTIPHHTWMRENCAGCHGMVTRAGTRTTHPWLTSCTQCHAPSATLDQVAFPGRGP